MRTITLILVLFFSLNLSAQRDTIIIDNIIARVGDEIILQSDVENTYFQWLAEGNSASSQAKCNVLEDILIQKLLLNQAHIDSIEITDDELDMQVDARLNMFVAQIGGITELENYLNKTIFDIKKDLKKSLRDQIIAQKMQASLTEDLTVTPSEVADYYNSLPIDSLPLIDISFEIRQISIYPELTEEEESLTLDKLEEIRTKIVSGDRRFESMARMYSEDPGSATKGGELGFFSRVELDPAFAAVAFSLEEGEISEIVKSQFGYHIIQLIERRGERVNVKHILLKPIIPISAKQRAIKKADTLRVRIIQDSIPFKVVAENFSQDDKTKNGGGFIFNEMTGNTKFTISELPHYIKYDVINLTNGEISKPIETLDYVGNTVYKIYLIESKVPEHVANMKDDYYYIHEMALNYHRQKLFSQWISKQQHEVYISIDKQYLDCKFRYDNWLKNKGL